MTHSLEELFAEAVELGERERASLAGMLINSLEPAADSKLEESWVAEIQRRIHALETGETAEVSWEEVRSRLWARFKRN